MTWFFCTSQRLTLSLSTGSRPGEPLPLQGIVHGKGNGSPGREPVLKDKVKRWLVQKNQVIAFTQASAADGGHGALLVLLAGR